jgi:hypothetical protein
MKKLIAAVEAALEKMQRDGIEGWGMNSLYKGKTEFGSRIECGPKYGCTSETCRHSSHDPAAATMKWIPPEEYSLSILGEDDGQTFYHLANGEDEHILVRIEGGHYHDRLQWGDFEDVPEWMLAQLVEK